MEKFKLVYRFNKKLLSCNWYNNSVDKNNKDCKCKCNTLTTNNSISNTPTTNTSSTDSSINRNDSNNLNTYSIKSIELLNDILPKRVVWGLLKKSDRDSLAKFHENVAIIEDYPQ